MPHPSLILGTHNRKKALELVELVAPVGIGVRTLADEPRAIVVKETGDSFAANATLKAVEQARHLGAWVLGEDSGIAVDALGGRPGIYSARYSGEHATDASNNQLLLAELADVATERRGAHYVCSLVLSDPTGTVRAQSEGRCYGRIRRQEVGSTGFGYDPLFEVVEYHRTMAELGETVKSVLSHRARAIERLLPQLAALVASGEWQS